MSKQPTRQGSRPEGRREEPRRREEEQQRIVHARRSTTIGLIAVGVLVVVGLVSLVMRQQQTPATPVVYPAIDHIPCQNTEQSGIHIHAHVTIYVNGKRILIPAHVGIAPDGSCLYWLHTHDESGVIHIEAPTGLSFTFGNFLDIWEQRFQQLDYPSQFSDPAGWQVYVDGKPFHGDVHSIPLHGHLLMTLAYHSPGVKPDTNYPWDGL
jgi:hypothetical protein